MQSNKTLYYPNGMVSEYDYDDISSDTISFVTNDENNTIYGYSGRQVKQSVDGWRTTTNVGPEIAGGTRIETIIPLENGELFVALYDGSVFVSQGNKTSYEFKLQVNGRVDSRFGTSVHKNVFFFNTYGPYEQETRFAYLSLDYGQTFTQVYEGEERSSLPEDRFHIHDCEYDPWTSTLWLVSGDQPTTSRYLYSRDFGKTWNDVTDGMNMGFQDTGVLALHDRLIFAPDDSPISMRQIKKDLSRPWKKHKMKDVENIWNPYTDEDFHLSGFIPFFAVKQRMQYPYNIVVVYDPTDNLNSQGFAIATKDAENWFVIADHRTHSALHANLDGGYHSRLRRIYGIDNDGFVYGSVYFENGTPDDAAVRSVQFRAKYPEWITNDKSISN